MFDKALWKKQEGGGNPATEADYGIQLSCWDSGSHLHWPI